MKTKFITISLLIISIQITIGQPNIEWQKSLGGTNSDVARSIMQTSDGGYIVAGYTSSNDGDVSVNNGSRDVWVVKLNNSGSIEWEKSYGGTGSDETYEIQQTIDGGYILTGMSDSNDFLGTGFGNDDIIVIKTNNNGIVEWGNKFGTGAGERGHSVMQTSDGNYIVAGFIGGGGTWVAKLDNTGSLDGNWTNTTFSGSQAYSVDETLDGGFVVAGYSNNGANGIDVRVFKLNAISNVLWDYNYGGTGADYGYSIQETTDGGFIVAGMTQSSNGDVTNNYGNQDFWVLKLNASGIMQWQKTYGGTQNDFATEIKQTSDGGYIVIGQTNSDDNDVSGNPGSYIFDYWVIKLNETGQLIWQSCLGGSSNDYGSSIQQTVDGGYIAAGRSISNNYDVSGNNGNYDFWVAKLEAETLSLNDVFNQELNVYPNPVSETLYISNTSNVESVKIYDTTGKCVINQKTVDYIDVKSLQPGIYFLKVLQGNLELTKKVIID